MCTSPLVGDGGAGPYYGLERLDRSAAGCLPSNRFPAAREAEYLGPEDIDIDTIPGVLETCHQGCAIYSYLVLNGPHRGTMWDGRDEFFATKLSFAAWYRRSRCNS